MLSFAGATAPAPPFVSDVPLPFNADRRVHCPSPSPLPRAIAPNHYAAAYLKLRYASAAADAEQGAVDAATIDRVVSALREVEFATARDAHSYDECLDGFVALVDGAVATATGNTSSSTSNEASLDDATASLIVRLVLRERLLSLLDAALDSADAGLALAERERNTALSGGRHPEGGTVGHYAGAVVEMLLFNSDRLADVGRSLQAGSGHRDAGVLALLGFASLPGPGAAPRTSSADLSLALYGTLKSLLAGVGRVARELGDVASAAGCETAPAPAMVRIRQRASLSVSRCNALHDAVADLPFSGACSLEVAAQSHALGAFDEAESALALLRDVLAMTRSGHRQPRGRGQPMHAPRIHQAAVPPGAFRTALACWRERSIELASASAGWRQETDRATRQLEARLGGAQGPRLVAGHTGR